MEIIALYNIKGGVGKTTTAVNLAYLSAADGWPTLLWDLDPQGAATYLLQSRPRRKGRAKQVIRSRRLLAKLVKPTEYPDLDILPADFSYRHMDLHLNNQKKPVKRLLQLMRPLQVTYGTVFLDCPPGISLVSENVMRAANALVIPVVPSPLSVRMLDQVVKFVQAKRWDNLMLLPFLSMVDSRRSLHRRSVTMIRERFPMTLGTEIPYASEIERASLRRMPLPAYAPRNPATETYRALWREIDVQMSRHRD